MATPAAMPEQCPQFSLCYDNQKSILVPYILMSICSLWEVNDMHATCVVLKIVHVYIWI